MSTPKLNALIARCRKPIFTTAEDVAQATAALLDLTGYLDSRDTRECLVPLKKFARHSPDTLRSALESAAPSPSSAVDGRRMAAVSRAIPLEKTPVTAALWAGLVRTTAAAFEAAAWSPADLKVVVQHIHRFSPYDAGFVEVAARYCGTAIPSAGPDVLPALVSIVTSLPELSTQPMRLLDAAAERGAVLAEALTPGAIGHLCGQLNRVQCINVNAVIAFQEEAGRCAEAGDAFTAVQLLYFVSRHKAAHVSSEAIVWLTERLTGEAMDTRSLELLCAAVVHMPGPTRLAVRQELLDFIAYLSTQATELLLQVPAAEGGLAGSQDAVAVERLVSHVLEMVVMLRSFGEAAQWPSEFLAAADACAAAVTPLQEALLSAESPPYGVMVRLLEAPSDASKRVGLAMLREAASQCLSLPTLQTFRFLLLMGDNGLHDLPTSRYLRDQFAKTAAEVPPVQLSVALRCLGVAVQDAGSAAPTNVDEEVERENLDAFLQFCVETARRHLAQGAPLRCVLSTTENLYKLGCRDTAFFADVAAYITARRAAVASTVAAESADSASAVCEALGEDLLEEHPAAHTFLREVVQQGVKGESAMLPTAWMNLHDPSNALLPLTEEQQESCDIVEEMVRTRSDDTATLVRLAERYIALLPHARPDDHKYFFGVFAEKVLKEDKLLKKCLDAMVDSGTLHRLSAHTIAAVLHSLAAIRFEYFASVKRFVSAITEEQWQSMEAAPLVQILLGMGQLSLRTPALLRRICTRLDVLYRFLSPLDTAQAVHALQVLGHNDPALLAKLMTHAAAMARRFDEVSVGLLFSSPSIHRLMSTTEVARPLLLQAGTKLRSQRQREKISVWLRRSHLPRDLIEESTRRLQVTSGGADGAQLPLRLT